MVMDSFSGEDEREKKIVVEEWRRFEDEEDSEEYLEMQRVGLLKNLEALNMVAQSNSPLDKIRFLPLLTTLLRSQRSLELQILGFAAIWLRPLPNGTLPHETIRTEILHSLTTEFHVPDIPQHQMSSFKHQVVETGLASAVANMCSNPDETEANRKIAHDLVHKWIYHFYYHKSTETSNTCKKQQPVQKGKITTAKPRGLGAKDRIEKRLRQLNHSSHRKFRCNAPAF